MIFFELYNYIILFFELKDNSIEQNTAKRKSDIYGIEI